MSQHDFEIANQGFPSFRSDLNSGLQALASNSAGATEPSATFAYQFWYDETTDLLKLRNSDDDAWITLAAFDQTNDEWEIRSAVIQAVDSAGVVIKTDDGTTRVTIADDGSVTVNTSLDVDNLKIDGNSITSTDTNGNINITPNGTGKVVLDGLNYPTADGTDGQVLTTDGSGNIGFESVGGITMADQWRLSTIFVPPSTSETLINTGWEQPDSRFSNIGSAMTESSGLFTFPETGIYLILLQVTHVVAGGDFTNVPFKVSTDSGSSFSDLSQTFLRNNNAGRHDASLFQQFLLNVTNASTFRVGLFASSFTTGGEVTGNTTYNVTSISFIRLGDT